MPGKHSLLANFGVQKKKKKKHQQSKFEKTVCVCGQNDDCQNLSLIAISELA